MNYVPLVGPFPLKPETCERLQKAEPDTLSPDRSSSTGPGIQPSPPFQRGLRGIFPMSHGHIEKLLMIPPEI